MKRTSYQYNLWQRRKKCLLGVKTTIWASGDRCIETFSTKKYYWLLGHLYARQPASWLIPGVCLITHQHSYPTLSFVLYFCFKASTNSYFLYRNISIKIEKLYLLYIHCYLYANNNIQWWLWSDFIACITCDCGLLQAIYNMLVNYS